jgi:hypothetical protein
MFFCTLVRKDAVMVQVLSRDDAMQSVVGETLAHGGHASVDAHQGLGLFTDLRREFPQATIITINLAALLNALDEAVEPEDA